MKTSLPKFGMVICRFVKPLLQKYICCELGKSEVWFGSSRLDQEGRLATVMNAGRDAMAARALRDWQRPRGRPSRGGLAPRRWCQVCGNDSSRRRWWPTSPAHQDDHGVTANPSRRECRLVSGEPVVNTLACFVSLSHARLRVHQHPAFPAPS